MLIKKLVEKEFDAKRIRVHAKCTDFCSTELFDKDGINIAEKEDGVPSFFPEDHYGEYLIFDIDIETGRILNWEKPEPAQVEEFYRNDCD